MQGTVSLTLRRLVLGGAFLAASLVALLPDVTAVIAAETPEPAAAASARATADAAQSAAEAAQEAAQHAREVAREARDKAREAAAVARESARDARRSGMEETPSVTIDHGGLQGDRRVRIELPGTTEEFQSFDQFVDRAPEIAAGVVLIVLIVFLTPIIIIVLVIWYKMRKNRMVNETLLKLAEKGVMPSPEAMQALTSGRAMPPLNALSTGMPLTEQAQVLRRTVAWSDLRRGVFMGMIGLAICVYSLARSASANWLGLVLLFVGIGYIALWYFEDQQVNAARRSVAAPTVGPPQDPAN